MISIWNSMGLFFYNLRHIVCFKNSYLNIIAMKKTTLLPFVSKPGRYLGNEFNTTQKEWDKTEVRIALLFPDLYEIGMSHLGLQILYHILNNEAGILAERSYCPDLDAEKIMRAKHLPLLSLESSTPVSSFDIVGITLPYELCYTNILTILDLAGIPRRSKDRNATHPIILGGGSCSLNPEPIADFFDAIVCGDGEDAVIEVANILREGKRDGITKHDIIVKLGQLNGVYIPSHFLPTYDSRNRIDNIKNLVGPRETIERRVVADLNKTAHLCKPIVPNAKVVHDRLGVEIARGCTRGCRFCQAGMIYRPVRERAVEQILDLAKSGIESSGFDELALLSLSTGDYSCINQLLPKLMDNFAADYVSVSMPSMRVGTLSQTVMDQIKRVRKTGFTLAPEAGSERLRKVINKGITEADLLRTCEDAFGMGWSAIKLYFMIGLPTETMTDIEEIALLVEKTRKVANSVRSKRNQVTTSVGTFVPKPHTPFQWEEQLSLTESRKRIRLLKEKMPRKGAKLKWHDPEMSFLEGVFSRGDRKLANLIEEAWMGGARLDGWSDHFDYTTWQEAAQNCNIKLSEYLRARDLDEILPWSHLSSGIDTAYLKDELQKAHQQAYTPDCRYHGCQQCGLCDFKTIMPIVQQRPIVDTTPRSESDDFQQDKQSQDFSEHYKYMVSYSRRGNISYLGHLEILQLIFRAIRRAKIKPHFSKGFNPSPKISFGGALPVGMESRAEFFIIDLPQPLENNGQTAALLSECLPQGLTITGIEPHSGQIPQRVINTYEVKPPRNITSNENRVISAFLAEKESLITRTRKGKVKQINIRPLIKDISITDVATLQLILISTAGTPGVKVSELLSHLFSWDEKDVLTTRITKTSWQPYDTA